MLRSAYSGHRPQGLPWWRVTIARVREQHQRGREPGWNEEFLLNGRGREHARDAMLHWRDPVERLRTLRRRRTLIDDNPCSG